MSEQFGQYTPWRRPVVRVAATYRDSPGLPEMVEVEVDSEVSSAEILTVMGALFRGAFPPIPKPSRSPNSGGSVSYSP